MASFFGGGGGGGMGGERNRLCNFGRMIMRSDSVKLF